MIQLIEMLMKALNMFGIKADLNMLDLPALLMKAGSIDSLKNELMHQFGAKLGLDGDIAKKVMGGVDLPSLDLDAMKNMDLSKLDMSSILGGAGMAGLAGTMMGGMGDKAKDAVGSMMGGMGNATEAVTETVGDTVSAGTDVVSSATDAAGNVVEGGMDMAGDAMGSVTNVAGNVAEGATDMASNTMGAAKEGMGDMMGNATDMMGKVMGGVQEAEKFASANQGIISKIMSFLGLK